MAICKAYRDQRGFTLTELLVALVAGMFVVAATIGLVTVQHRTHFVQDQIVDAQQHARIALDMISRDLRMAGYNPRECFDVNGNSCFAVDPSTWTNTVIQLRSDINENGALDAEETVTYRYDANSKRLTRETVGSNAVDVTPRDTVNSFTLNCMIWKQSTGTAGPCVASLNAGDIIRVTLTLTTRTTNEDPYFTDTTGMFGVNVEGSASDGTARLRRLSTAVTLRNI